MKEDLLTRRRTYIDLIQGKKFNSKQREMVRKAVDELELHKLRFIAKEGFSAEQMEQMIKFLKNETYKENKNLFVIFNRNDIDWKILEQINKGLENGLREELILMYARPEEYDVSQMMQLRIFLKEDKYDDEYKNYMFDHNKTSEAMEAINKAINLNVPINDIKIFDCYSELYPTMVSAVCAGLLPKEVDMILDVTKDKDMFDTMVHAYENGLSDEEIVFCLNGEENHLMFHLNLLAECHDLDFLQKVMSIPEIQRRNFIETFTDEKRYFDFLLRVQEYRRLPDNDQVSVFLSECRALDEKQLLFDDGYLDEYISSLLKYDDVLAKMKLEGFLLEGVSKNMKMDRIPESSETIAVMLRNFCMDEYKGLLERKDDMNHFLRNINQIDILMQNRKGEAEIGKGFISFYMNDGFEIRLKEYKDYFNLDEVVIHYDEDKVCTFSSQILEKQAKEFAKLYMNDRGKINMQREGNMRER